MLRKAPFRLCVPEFSFLSAGGGQRQENFRSRATKRVWNVLLCSLPLWSFSRRFRRFRIPYRSGLSAFWLLPGRNRWQLITYLYFSLYWRNFFKYSLKYRHMSFQNVRIDSRSLPTYEADLPLKFFFPQHKKYRRRHCKTVRAIRTLMRLCIFSPGLKTHLLHAINTCPQPACTLPCSMVLYFAPFPTCPPLVMTIPYGQHYAFLLHRSILSAWGKYDFSAPFLAENKTRYLLNMPADIAFHVSPGNTGQR